MSETKEMIHEKEDDDHHLPPMIISLEGDIEDAVVVILDFSNPLVLTLDLSCADKSCFRPTSKSRCFKE